MGSFSCEQPGVEVRVQSGVDVHVQPGVEICVQSGVEVRVHSGVNYVYNFLRIKHVRKKMQLIKRIFIEFYRENLK